MPDPSNYASESEFMADCVPMMEDEGKPHDQAVAACLDMWRNRSKAVPTMNRAYSILDIKEFDQEQRIIEGIATTPTPDRLGDIVAPMGAKFSLPMPLLWQHKHDQPVGHVVAAKPTKEGIPVRIRIPKIEEPGELKNLVDRAWQSVKAQLVRGLSIGFKPIKDSIEVLDDGGFHFKKWDWLELSLVTIPANQEATIQTIKSIDSELRAASGRDEPSVDATQSGDTDALVKTKRPGASGKSSIALTKRSTGTMSKTFGEQIAALEATRSAKSARMEEIMQKAVDEGRSTDEAEQEEFDTLQDEMKQLEGDLKRFHALEKLNQSKATPVQAKSVQEGAETRTAASPIRVTPPQVPPGIRFARAVKAIGLSYLQRRDVGTLAEQMYPDDPLVQKAAVAGGTTASGSWTGALVGDEASVFADFVEFLRPMTLLGRFGTNGVPALRSAPFRVPLIGQTGGGQGYWVGQGAAKPLTAFDFERKTLEPLKVANIAVVTEEVLRDSSPSADTILRDSLAAALRERLDVDFIDPSVGAQAGVRPASVTNGVAGTGSAGADADGVRTDVAAIVAAFLAENNPPSSGVWIMSAQTALRLSLMVNALGNPEFPTITMGGGTFFGMPVITSEYIAHSGSPLSSYVVLANASDIYLGDEGGINIDMSREASLQMDDSPTQHVSTGSPLAPVASTTVSLWQTNAVGFRAERTINWMKRRAGAVKVITGVAWAPSS